VAALTGLAWAALVLGLIALGVLTLMGVIPAMGYA
jgi:hypothetical protein